MGETTTSSQPEITPEFLVAFMKRDMARIEAKRALARLRAHLAGDHQQCIDGCAGGE